MRQPIIAVTSLLAGFVVMGLVASIERDPLAWTHAAPPFPSTSMLKATATRPTDPRRKEPPNGTSGGVVTLPAVRITAERTAARPERKRESKALEPCSEWRELGPEYVEEGKPRGTRRVRSLC